MLDINSKLNEIIFNYDLDKNYPQYRKIVEADKVLKNVVNAIVANNESVLFIGDIESKLGFERIYHMARKYKNMEFALFSEEKEECLEVTKLLDYDAIYILPYKNFGQIEQYLKMNHISYKRIYDIFEDSGIAFERDFYKFNKIKFCKNWGYRKDKNEWENSCQAELGHEAEKIEKCQNLLEQQVIIENCFFLSICMKNFILAQEYVNQLKKIGAVTSLAISAWKEIEILLNTIKSLITEKRKEHIVVYWLDAISYEQATDMAYLQSRMESSICFSNAFTVCARTFPTGKAMFCGLYEVDDKGYKIRKITMENSPVLRCLEENGYSFKVVSPYMHAWYDSQYVSECYHEVYSPCSMIFWDLLQNMLISEKNTMFLAHAFCEGHSPFFNMNLDSDNIKPNRQNQRRRLAKQDLDQQLAFYEQFISPQVTRIYMSDHGWDMYKDKYHILFSIWSNKYSALKVESLFSIIDFPKLLKDLLSSDIFDPNAYEREHINVERLPWYHPKQVQRILSRRERVADMDLGERGVITKEHIYIKFNTGKEWLAKRNDIQFEPISPLKNSDSIDEHLYSEYRKLVGINPPDLMQDNKFFYSRYLQKLYENQKKYASQRMILIDELISELSYKNIAIRTGGEHSVLLYSCISKQSRAKISCFIDENPHCLCERFGLPIVSLEESMQQDIDGVILSSFDYLPVLKKEVEDYRDDIAVIDIYDYLEKQGLKNKKNFFVDIDMPEEEWDVGFPFEEFD